MSESPAAVERGVELTTRRTRRSRSFRLDDGSIRTRVFQRDVNYLDSGGAMKTIDNRLEPSGPDRFENRANRLRVSLPRELDGGPVRVSVGTDRWVSFSLDGARGQASATVDGATARYESAMDGVDLEYTALGDLVKETLVLKGPDGPSSFGYTLRASEGLAPRITEGGAIEFRDSADEVAFELPAPFVVDNGRPQPPVSTAARYDLHDRGTGAWRLVVSVDREWLSAPERRWPVRLDPTVRTPGPVDDCGIAYPTRGTGGPWCATAGHQSHYIGLYPSDEDYYPQRWLMRFDLSGIPQDAYVSDAVLGINTTSSADSRAEISVFPLSKPWTRSVNWYQYDGANNWQMGGGDYTFLAAKIRASDRGGPGDL